MQYNRRDKIYLVIIVALVIGLPVAIFKYDGLRTKHEAPSTAKIFTLTGSIDHGWTKGALPAWKMLALDLQQSKESQAVIEVHRGDLVSLKLTSNDVIHGFSLKDFGVFVNKGIKPGKPIIVTFTADKVGEFIFSCNAICGKNHESMQGILRVTG